MPPPTLVPLDPFVVRSLVEASLAEDRADQDLTTLALSGWLRNGQARIVARDHGVVCGLTFAEAAFRAVSVRGLSFRSERRDGSHVARGDVIATVKGRLTDLLRAERVALNWLQRLSGTATLTSKAVAAARRGGHAQILDTRKTTPGIRTAERYAVRCGGALNHRDNLAAAVLVKDSHIAAVQAAEGSLHEAVRTVLQAAGPGTAVEIEVTNLNQAREALEAGARSLLLDNFAVDDLPAAVELARKHRATVEASGGIRLNHVEAIAATGVDFISLGILTHSAPALDIALEVRSNPPRRDDNRSEQRDAPPPETHNPTEPAEPTATQATTDADAPNPQNPAES